MKLVRKMQIYYQNTTLYIKIMNNLDELEYLKLKQKLFHIIEEYGVSRIVVQNYRQIFSNRYFIRQIKQDFQTNFQGDFLIC